MYSHKRGVLVVALRIVTAPVPKGQSKSASFIFLRHSSSCASELPSELPHAMLSPRVAEQLTHCGLPRRHGRAADEGFPTGE